MGLIKRFPIDSDEFYEHLHPYLRENTRHFMHEFLFFARSPYSMETYDTKAIYEDASTDSSSNSDVVVVDDDDAPEAGRPGQSRSAVAGPSNPQFSVSLWEQQLMGILNLNPATSLARAGWDSPTPGPSWDFGRNSSQSPVNVVDSSDSDASTIIDPSFISPETSNTQPSRSRSSDDSDDDAVIFISYDKPWEERSPIQLSSGSDDEAFSKFAKKLKREHKKKKDRSSAGTSGADRHGRRSRGERSRSLTPPAAHRTRSRSPVSRASSHHDPHVSSRRKSRHQGKSHHKKHGYESKEGSHHSSRSGHSEKRTHSASSSSSRPAKKRHHSNKPRGDDAKEDHESQHKKHKHKRKHKKEKDKSARHSKRPHENSICQNGISCRTTLGASSSAVRDEGDRCKKHPSGHKRSRVQESGSRNETEAREGISSHHSDGPMSDTSTSSNSSTTTTTSTVSMTGREPRSARYFSRQQRLQQAMQARHLPSLPRLDFAPAFENMSWLTRLLSSYTLGSQGELSSEPVVIASSDESEGESPFRRHENNHVAGDSMDVAKTVVVPCSSRQGEPTAAIDPSGATTSTSVSRPAIAEECIDVDSISSDDDYNDSVSEVVDVESLEDSGDGSAEPVSSSDAQEADAISTNSQTVMEVSAEAERTSVPVTMASAPTSAPANPFSSVSSFSIESILKRDRASMSSKLSTTSHFPSAGQMSVSRGLNFYTQLRGKPDDDAADTTSLPGGVFSCESELVDTDSDVEIVPQHVCSLQKAQQVLQQSTTGNCHRNTHAKGKDVDVVDESAHLGVTGGNVPVQEQPPSPSLDPCSVVSDATGFEKSLSIEQQSPSQSLSAALIASDSKDVDSTDSAIGSSPLDQRGSPQREDRASLVQQTAEEAGHTSAHYGVETVGRAAESYSTAPISSSSGCDLPSALAEESDVSLGDTDTSYGESDISVGEADVSVGEAEVSVGEADISVGESDISVGDELLGSRDACADGVISTQQDVPNITKHSGESKARVELDGSAALASSAGTPLSKLTNDYAQVAPVAAASSTDGKDAHCLADQV